MDTDRNLLFGVPALQADLIDAQQFAEACTQWTSRKHPPLEVQDYQHGGILQFVLRQLLGRK